jgi:hypothetical protein
MLDVICILFPCSHLLRFVIFIHSYYQCDDTVLVYMREEYDLMYVQARHDIYIRNMRIR